MNAVGDRGVEELCIAFEVRPLFSRLSACMQRLQCNCVVILTGNHIRVDGARALASVLRPTTLGGIVLNASLNMVALRGARSSVTLPNIGLQAEEAVLLGAFVSVCFRSLCCNSPCHSGHSSYKSRFERKQARGARRSYHWLGAFGAVCLNPFSMRCITGTQAAFSFELG